MREAALLLRCSTNLQDYNRQKNDLLALADKLGFNVREEYIFGEYVTGKDDIRKGNRQSIQSLIDVCLESMVDAVLIWEVSRLSRNFIYGVTTIDKFNRDYKIPIYFRDKRKWTIDIETGKIDIDFEKDLGKYFEQAEAELITLRSRLASGKRDAAGLNQVIGSVAPFGYDRVNKRNVINPVTSLVVKEMYEKYLEEGATLLSVSSYLSAKYPQYIVKLRSAGSIRNILVNKANTGILVYTIYDEIDDIGYRYEVMQPSIISVEVYNAVLAKLKKNRTITAYPHSKKHLLQKMLFCYECGTCYTPSESLKRGTCYYRCGQKTAHIKPCNNSMSLNESIIDSVIWKFLKEQLFSESELNKEQREIAIEKEEENRKNIVTDIEIVEGAIANTYKDLDSLEDMLITRRITSERFDKKKAKIDTKLGELKHQKDKLRERINAIDFNIKRLNNLDYTQSFFNEVENDLEKKIALLKEYVQFIYPYMIGKNIVLLKTHTVDGIYYIFYRIYKGNFSKDKIQRTAYYIHEALAEFKPNGNNNFYVPNPSILGIDNEYLYYFVDEMKEVCENNGFEFEY